MTTMLVNGYPGGMLYLLCCIATHLMKAIYLLSYHDLS